MKISVYNSQRDLKISLPSVRLAMKASLALYGIDCDEAAVHFVSQKRIRALHLQFFNDPSITDCISFPSDKDRRLGYFFLGEIFVAPRTAKDYVSKKGGEVYEEVTLYMVHGLLHLMGYDDINPLERKKMRLQENKILKHLKNQQLLLHP